MGWGGGGGGGARNRYREAAGQSDVQTAFLQYFARCSHYRPGTRAPCELKLGIAGGGGGGGVRAALTRFHKSEGSGQVAE